MKAIICIWDFFFIIILTSQALGRKLSELRKSVSFLFVLYVLEAHVNKY